MLKAAVVVPAYNAAPYLDQCLTALTAQQLPANLNLQIIVVDDGSADGTAHIAEAYAGKGVLLVRQAHRGAAAARNSGLKAADSDCSLILFTDADCTPAPDWACQLIRALEQSGPEVAGVKGVYRTRQTAPVARFTQAEFELRYARFQSQQVNPDFADTYSAGYRREILADYPFDESLPGAIVEDAELGWRLRQAGYSFRFVPEAVVYHQHPATAAAYFQRKLRIGRWRVRLYRRYPAQLSHESHTTRLAKLQMAWQLLAITGLGSSLLTLPWPRLNRLSAEVSLAGLGLLQVSFWPFYRQSRLPARLVWPMLNARTLALTSGAVLGGLELLGQNFSKFLKPVDPPGIESRTIVGKSTKGTTTN